MLILRRNDMKKKYLAISEKHFIDQETFKIVEKAKRKSPNICRYPYYFPDSYKTSKTVSGFSISGGVLGNNYNISEDSNEVVFNQIRVAPISGKFNHRIKFYDNRKKERHTIDIFAEVPHYMNGNPDVYCVDFDIHFDESASKTFNYKVESPTSKFHAIASLIQNEFKVSTSRKYTFNTGLLGSQYILSYKGRQLEGKCYVFMNRQWCIILQDDLSLDAIALMESWGSNKITISEFIYTSNPYLIKCIMLWK
jgi:hypothetical protein